jgi:hypothetical protein
MTAQPIMRAIPTPAAGPGSFWLLEQVRPAKCVRHDCLRTKAADVTRRHSAC